MRDKPPRSVMGGPGPRPITYNVYTVKKTKIVCFRPHAKKIKSFGVFMMLYFRFMSEEKVSRLEASSELLANCERTSDWCFVACHNNSSRAFKN